jgi:transposase
MTLHANDNLAIPEETARVAKATFPKGNVYMTLRDELALWYKDSAYAHLFPSHQGRPAESPGMLNLILIMQYAEGLSDPQTAEAVRSRIDWKYALGLALTDPGFHYSILTPYRDRLLAGGAEEQCFTEMLTHFRARGLLRARGQQRTDSTHVLAAIRDLNRLELIGETLRHALNCLAVVLPDWLRTQVTPDWFELYGTRFEQYRLPQELAKQHALAERMGRDGQHLLAAVDDPATPGYLREIPGIQTLHRVWAQQFLILDDQVCLRTGDSLPRSAELISSPYDDEARFSQKRQTKWVGYKVHLTETCDEDLPHLVTNVETTPATTPDNAVTSTIHQHLDEKGLLPQEHLVDTGYTDAKDLVASDLQHGVELLGPVQEAHTWQDKANQGFQTACFEIDWQAQHVICPQGKLSALWRPCLNKHGGECIAVRFARQDCLDCPVRAQCTHSPDGPRTLTLLPQAQHVALQQAREYQKTDAFRRRYRKRAGVEGTISQGTRAFDLRQTRYIGLAKTHLQHLFTAAAINLARAVLWLQGIETTQTRRSSFAALAPAT